MSNFLNCLAFFLFVELFLLLLKIEIVRYHLGNYTYKDSFVNDNNFDNCMIKVKVSFLKLKDFCSINKQCFRKRLV